MMETGNAQLTYSLEHKECWGGRVNTCIQRANDGFTQTVVYVGKLGWGGQTHNGKKRGSENGVEGLSGGATPRPRSPCRNCRP